LVRQIKESQNNGYHKTPIDERYPDDDEIALSKKHVIKFMKAKGWYDK